MILGGKPFIIILILTLSQGAIADLPRHLRVNFFLPLLEHQIISQSSFVFIALHSTFSSIVHVQTCEVVTGGLPCSTTVPNICP